MITRREFLAGWSRLCAPTLSSMKEVFLTHMTLVQSQRSNSLSFWLWLFDFYSDGQPARLDLETSRSLLRGFSEYLHIKFSFVDSICALWDEQLENAIWKNGVSRDFWRSYFLFEEQFGHCEENVAKNLESYSFHSHFHSGIDKLVSFIQSKGKKDH